MSGPELPLAAEGARDFRRPVLLVVSSEPGLARATEQQLRRAFGPEEFDTARAESTAEALDLFAKVRDSDGQVALVVTDHRIEGGTGVALIDSARRVFAEMRTILLTDYCDIDEAVAALGPGGLDHFFIKPLGPPEEQLLPAVAELMTDWRRWADEATRAVRIVAKPNCEKAHELRDFLRRNDIRHHLLDAERQEGRLLAGDVSLDGSRLPLVVTGDGSRLENPTTLELAERLGLPTRASRDFYDVAIVGGGPAGLAAAVYAASEGLSTVVLEQRAPGGQAGQSARIENYLGFPSGLRGGDLAQRALRQGRRFGAEILRMQDVVGLSAEGPHHALELARGGTLRCHAVVVSCGVDYRRLEAPGTDELLGRGVFYGAAMTEAEYMRGRRVYVVGGANSAGQAALHFAEYAAEVTVVVRGPSIEQGMSQYLVDRIAAAPNVAVLTRTRVVAASGSDRLQQITLADDGASTETTVDADGLFIFIGAVPHTAWLSHAVACDERGFILTGRDVLGADCPERWPLDRDPYLLEASVPGIFAAGDVRHGSLKRVASAVGEGAMAVAFIHKYLAEVREAGITGMTVTTAVQAAPPIN